LFGPSAISPPALLKFTLLSATGAVQFCAPSFVNEYPIEYGRVNIAQQE